MRILREAAALLGTSPRVRACEGAGGSAVSALAPSRGCSRSRCCLTPLLFASQEVVRDPPYGVRGSAHRVGDLANRSRALRRR